MMQLIMTTAAFFMLTQPIEMPSLKMNVTVMYKNNRMLPDELQHSLDKAKKDLPQ